MLRTDEIRKLYIDYFIKCGHLHLPSSSLVPFNDSSLLFANAGMVQFKDFFTGIATPPNKTIVTCQKCLRAGGKHNDLDNVGYTARHHTFFEMLGNFSFGEYFKEGAIFHAWNLITKELGLSKDRLSVTIYHDDNEAADLWKKISGLEDSKILRIATEDNFWSMGDTGPCGPCSEIFYDQGENFSDDERFLEIWNLVFMQFEKFADGSIVPLSKPCIDTGMGLERIASVVQGCSDNYENDVFKKIINDAEKILDSKCTSENISAFKVVADHLRAACFAISDGIIPSNEGRDYVIRRIIRRGICYSYKISSQRGVLSDLVPNIISVMVDAYPELERNKNSIQSIISSEEDKFSSTLDSGIKILQSELSNLSLKPGDIFPGELAFKLYDTFGFPIDMTSDVLRDYNLSVDITKFEECLDKQKSMSIKFQKESKNIDIEKIISNLPETKFVGYDHSSVSAKIIHSIDIDLNKKIIITDVSSFYAESGGQVGDTGSIFLNNGASFKVVDTKKSAGQVILHYVEVSSDIKFDINQVVTLEIDKERRNLISLNHSATHLLGHALRKIISPNIVQKGSLVSFDKLRFDFNYDKKLSDEQISSLEDEINKQIMLNYATDIQIMAKDDAIKLGAQAIFNEKYGDMVRVVKIGDSIELCGGTHVKSSSEIGFLKIVKTMSVASGIRRIEALVQSAALGYVNSQNKILKEISSLYQERTEDILDRVSLSLKKERELNNLQIKYAKEIDYYSKKIGIFDYKVKVLEDFSSKNIIKILSSNSISLILVKNSNEYIVSLGVNDLPKVSAKEVLGKIFSEFFAGNKFGGTDLFACGRVEKEYDISAVISYLEKLLLQME